MEALSVDQIPHGPGWQYEPKWDGFRCLAFRDGDSVYLQSKGEKPLGRYFPEIVEAVKALKPKHFVLDGELAVPVEGKFNFAKLLESPYRAGERDAVQKIKLVRTADCVVGGFRYGSGRRLVGSLLLGLYDDEGLLNHVGFTSAMSEKERRELTKKLEKLLKPP